MFAAITMIVIIWICMWIFYKFMYPRAPKSMMPKEGDVTTVRNCNFCGHSLAEYRGVVETKAIAPETSSAEPSKAKLGKSTFADNASNIDSVVQTQTNHQQELFFCNYEHQADFHAGKTYQ